MIKYIPIIKKHNLSKLDNDEVLEGYVDGTNNEPEPKGNRSFSYWHGWCNGMADAGHRKINEAQRKLAKDWLK